MNQPKTDLKEFLSSISQKRIAFVGIGNTLKGDDAVGCYIIEFLKDKLKCENFFLVNAGISVENYLSKIIEFKPEVVLFIDALREKNSQVNFLILQKDNIQNYSFSTHNISLVTLIEYLQQYLDKTLFFVLAIKSDSFDINSSLSKNTKELADKIIGIFLDFFKEEAPNART